MPLRVLRDNRPHRLNRLIWDSRLDRFNRLWLRGNWHLGLVRRLRDNGIHRHDWLVCGLVLERVAESPGVGLGLSGSTGVYLGLEALVLEGVVVEDSGVGLSLGGCLGVHTLVLGLELVCVDVLGTDVLGIDSADISHVVIPDEARVGSHVVGTDALGADTWLGLILDGVVEVAAPCRSDSLSPGVDLGLEALVLESIITEGSGVGLSLGGCLGVHTLELLGLGLVCVDVLGTDVLGINSADISHVVIPDEARVGSHVVGTDALGADTWLGLILDGVVEVAAPCRSDSLSPGVDLGLEALVHDGVVVFEEVPGVGLSLGRCLSIHTLLLGLELVRVDILNVNVADRSHVVGADVLSADVLSADIADSWLSPVLDGIVNGIEVSSLCRGLSLSV